MLMNEIYTDLCLKHLERRTWNRREEKLLASQFIWKPLWLEIAKLSQDGLVKTLLTKGVSGIGKTVLMQALSSDWPEDKVNNNIQFVFPFTFRELNSLKEKNWFSSNRQTINVTGKRAQIHSGRKPSVL